MKFVEVDYEEAHDIVTRNRFLEWDGWDIVTWRKDPRGYSDRRGAFRRGDWGILFRYRPQKSGTWSIPENYVRRTA